MIDEAQIEKAIAAGRTASAEFTQSDFEPGQLERLNELCRKHGPKLRVRFYGYYRSVFDANVLQQLPDVQNLAIDCIDDAILNVERIGELRHLRRFGFGTKALDRPDFLSLLDLSNVEVLGLGENAKHNLDLAPLAQARRLRKLEVQGHSKGIASLSGLPLLEQLTLRSLRKNQSLSFLAEIEGLRVLNLILGGHETLLDLTHEGLEFLHMTQVNGLGDLGPIRRFKRLKGLGVQEQSRVGAIDLTGASLNFFSLYNCKSLKEVKGLMDQQELIQLFVIGTQLPFDELRDRAWPKSLRVLRLHSKNMKWNEATRAGLEARGYLSQGGRWFTSDLDEIY